MHPYFSDGGIGGFLWINAYSTKQLMFEWKGDTAVEINPELELSQFRLKDIKLHSFIKNYTTGSFSGLEAKFYLKRDLGFYMIQTYIPSLLIVVLSWVSFWLSSDAVPARISLGVLTVLTMTTMTSGMATQLPRVSYVKAMDVWLSTCQFFVFAALLEFAFVNWLTRREIKRNRRKRRGINGDSIKCNFSIGCSRCYINPKSPTQESDEPTAERVIVRRDTRIFSNKKTQAEQLDHFAQPLFPLAFLLFNIVYWPFYSYWDV